MRCSKWVLVVAASVCLAASIAWAENTPSVAPLQRVTFTTAMRVGDTLLPKGDYEVRHVMEGEKHIMVFHSLTQKKVADVRIQCTLEPLAQKANETQTVYTLNAAKEPVLQQLIFRGESAKHVF
jgi:hypothetical protein